MAADRVQLGSGGITVQETSSAAAAGAPPRRNRFGMEKRRAKQKREGILNGTPSRPRLPPEGLKRRRGTSTVNVGRTSMIPPHR